MILMFGGTGESHPLAAALAEAGLRVLVSTATDEPLALPGHPLVRRRHGRLDAAALTALLRAEQIAGIVDAAHPFADILHRTVAEVAETLRLPLWRYDRAGGTPETAAGLHRRATHAEAAALAFHLGRNPFLTTGSKVLAPYLAAAANCGGTCHARVLDSGFSLEGCDAAGFPRERLVLGRGPFTVAENLEHLRLTGCDVLVTKDSGPEGGVPEKIEAARRLGLPVILVGRPQVPAYGEPHSDRAALVRAVRAHFAPLNPHTPASL